MDCVLAVDLGTSGPKVALVSETGAVIDSDYEPTSLILTGDGGVEQDPEEWWRAITTATRRMMDRAPVTAERVIGVCCTAQWLGTVAVDGAGRHLMNAIIWMDARGAPYMPDITGGTVTIQGYEPRKITRWIKVSGGAPGHSGKDPTAHILWIKHHRPDVYRETRTFLEPKDYLNLRLTGRAVASVDSIAGHFVTDNRDLDHVIYDDQLIEFSQLDRATLPDLVRAVDVVGPFREGRGSRARRARGDRSDRRDPGRAVGNARVGCAGGLPGASLPRHVVVDHVPRTVQEDRPLREHGVATRRGPGPLLRRQRPGDRRRVPGVVARQRGLARRRARRWSRRRPTHSTGSTRSRRRHRSAVAR